MLRRQHHSEEQRDHDLHQGPGRESLLLAWPIRPDLGEFLFSTSHACKSSKSVSYVPAPPPLWLTASHMCWSHTYAVRSSRELARAHARKSPLSSAYRRRDGRSHGQSPMVRFLPWRFGESRRPHQMRQLPTALSPRVRRSEVQTNQVDVRRMLVRRNDLEQS